MTMSRYCDDVICGDVIVMTFSHCVSEVFPPVGAEIPSVPQYTKFLCIVAREAAHSLHVLFVLAPPYAVSLDQMHQVTM
ncbi:unnamed protein product [Gongylonema pulchrum]|uniref:Piwi domain-containing protein n=1 Tax=Gongylonema pulchrum TaxID=637853 RepID=A0A183ERL6_9BILA|nr:unnamed protein product [Gongylonema pulchrum]